MKHFDLQGVQLDVPARRAFSFIADAAQLPRWTSAFASVHNGQAVMRTPRGNLTVNLEVAASMPQGTVDWRIIFPDGSIATACSRVVELAADRCVFTFVLTSPPVPLEQLEGTLEAQSRTLAEELLTLKRILED